MRRRHTLLRQILVGSMACSVLPTVALEHHRARRSPLPIGEPRCRIPQSVVAVADIYRR